MFEYQGETSWKNHSGIYIGRYAQRESSPQTDALPHGLGEPSLDDDQPISQSTE